MYISKIRIRLVRASIVFAGVCLAVFAAYLWLGPELLHCGYGFRGRLGREALSLRVRLGIAGPALLLSSQDAAIRSWADDVQHYGYDAPYYEQLTETLALVEKGYGRLSRNEKDQFITAVEGVVCKGPPVSLATHHREALLLWLCNTWGKQLSKEAVLQGCSSSDKDVRYYCIDLLVSRDSQYQKADIRPLIRQLFDEGDRLGNESMMREALLIAVVFRMRPFLQQRQERIHLLCGSKDCLVRRWAKIATRPWDLPVAPWQSRRPSTNEDFTATEPSDNVERSVKPSRGTGTAGG